MDVWSSITWISIWLLCRKVTKILEELNKEHEKNKSSANQILEENNEELKKHSDDFDEQ